MVTGVRCRSDESGNDKNQGKQDAQIQGAPSTTTLLKVFTQTLGAKARLL